MSPAIKGVIVLLCISGLAMAQSYEASSHGNRSNLPAGCASCHLGHGSAETPMLVSTTVNDSCFTCHGTLASRLTAIREGVLSSRFLNMPDLTVEFLKKFNHNTSTFESRTPVISGKNHCGACHNPHYSGGPNPFQGKPGITLEGVLTSQALYQYEVCFQCHSQPTGRIEIGLRDIRLEFNTAIAISNHPIDRTVSDGYIKSVSLIEKSDGYSMTCSTCHGNSNPNGPKGIHSSDYPYMLKRYLEVNDYVPETESGNALCYECHRRESILQNESFSYHSEHVSGVFTATPCITCHSGHGSVSYPYLLSFNPRVVSPTALGLLSFQVTGERAGVCYLTCHNKEHNGSSYFNSSEENTSNLKRQGPIISPNLPFPPTKRPTLFSRPGKDKHKPKEQ